MKRNTVSLQQTVLSLRMWWQVLKGVQARTISQRVIISEAWVVVQSLNCIQLRDPMDCSTLGFPDLHYLPDCAQTHVHQLSDAIQSFHPLVSPSPPDLNLSQHQGLFKWVGSSLWPLLWPKYWSFSFSISPSNEHPGLISFRMDWLDPIAVQGALMSLLQHHSSKASIHQCSAFFMVQLSHPYMTPGKTIALTWQTFVGKVMSLLFNIAV